MGIIYKMSKRMYDSIRYPYYDEKKGGDKKVKERKRKPLTHQEVLDYVNQTYGMNKKIVKIEFCEN